MIFSPLSYAALSHRLSVIVLPRAAVSIYVSYISSSLPLWIELDQKAFHASLRSASNACKRKWSVWSKKYAA